MTKFATPHKGGGGEGGRGGGVATTHSKGNGSPDHTPMKGWLALLTEEVAHTAHSSNEGCCAGHLFCLGPLG